jgi:hypothetical protein
MNEGIYELLVTQLIQSKINDLDKTKYQVREASIDKEEAATILSQHLSNSIKKVLLLIKGDNTLEKQIDIANKIILS